jgi:hypothetical protein
VRTPQEQDAFLQFGRFGKSSTKHRRPIRKWALIFLLVLAATYIASRLLAFRKTVLEEERFGNEYVRYGFAVQQPSFGSLLSNDGPFGTVIHLWTHDAKGRFENIYLDTPWLRLVNIKRHEWLANNQAILLHLDTEVDLQSYTQPDERWVLYNFRSGELRTCSSFEQTPCTDLQAYAQKLR